MSKQQAAEKMQTMIAGYSNSILVQTFWTLENGQNNTEAADVVFNFVWDELEARGILTYEGETALVDGKIVA